MAGNWQNLGQEEESNTIGDEAQNRSHNSDTAEIFASNCKKYLSQIAKSICLKLQKIFVSIAKMYLTRI